MSSGSGTTIALPAAKRVEPQRVPTSPQPPAEVASSRNGDRLLDVLKEELFQLEVERPQGKISAEEYEKAKAALDTTLARAAKRASS